MENNQGSCRVVALKYGQTVLSHKLVFVGGSEEEFAPISLTVYLVEDGDRRILIDAGCRNMPGFPLSHFVSPAEVLARYGLSASQITDVVITHGHHDHVEAVSLFDQATVHIEKRELERAKKHLCDGMTINAFDDEFAVTDTLTVKRIGGHSPGSCIALLRTAQKTLVFCGDECYSPINLKEKRPTGSSCDPEKSLAFVMEYSQDAYLPLLAHDPGILPNENGYTVVYEQ